MNNDIVLKNDEILQKDHKLIFKMIVESFIEDGIPVGSKTLVEKYNLQMSSAKVRYIMGDLEKNGFLVKNHTSSGRIPSTAGYKYYAQHIVEVSTDDLREKLEDLFAQRRLNITKTINDAAQIISDAVGLTLVTSESNEDSMLKSIQLVPLTDFEAIVVLVTSYGEVYHKNISLDAQQTSMEDLRIAIRIFKERLINIKIKDLKEHATMLKPILEKAIKNYESLLQKFVSNIFDLQIHNENTVFGKDKIILADDISRQQLSKIINLIENKSIWETIEGKLDDDHNIKIAIREDNSSFISKKLNFEGKIKEISVVGSNRMDYKKGITALEILEDLIINNKE